MLSYRMNLMRRIIFLKSFLIAYKNGYDLPPPRYVLWDCTRKCNLNCLHCGASKEIYDKELSEIDVKKLIDELAIIGVRTFAATGGEPLTRQDLLEILKYASVKGLKTGIATNGFFIDKDMAQKIKNAGVNSIQISVDGTNQIHNQIRGNIQSYDKAINAINFLNNANIEEVSVATTVMPSNFNYLDDLKTILMELKINSWRLSVVMPIGRAAPKKLLLSKEQLINLFNFIYKTKNEIHIELGENLPFLGKFDSKIRSAPLICPIGFSACCIGTNGFVRGCPEEPDTEKFREGSILNQPFSDIWKNGFKKYRDREILKNDKKCAVCNDKNYCFGGCWVMREGNIHCIYHLI